MQCSILKMKKAFGRQVMVYEERKKLDEKCLIDGWREVKGEREYTIGPRKT